MIEKRKMLISKVVNDEAICVTVEDGLITILTGEDKKFIFFDKMSANEWLLKTYNGELLIE